MQQGRKWTSGVGEWLREESRAPERSPPALMPTGGLYTNASTRAGLSTVIARITSSGKPLAAHFGNDVLENVAVAVPAISDKPVFGADVLAMTTRSVYPASAMRLMKSSLWASLGISISARG